MEFHEKDKKKRLRQGQPWSDQELADLRAMYPSRTARALELHFGRSWLSIRHKVQEQGLKKPPNKTRKKGRPWSDLEVKLLRELYPDPDTPLEEIGAHFIGRSLTAVAAMAHLLGLRRVNLWTEEEIAVLRQLWPDKTLAELVGILERSPRAIKRKAYKLGLRRRPMVAADPRDDEAAMGPRERKSRRRAVRPWSREEVQCLQHMYRTHSLEEIAKNLDHRSVASIKNKASELGLTQKKGWTAEQDNLIREYYHLGLSWREIAKRLNRSKTGVQLRERALGLERKGFRSWTPREDGFLREHWSTRDAGELAEQLDRTVRAVLTRACRLGLRAGR